MALLTMAIYNAPKPDPRLLSNAIIGARFTPIHVLMILVTVSFPLMMFLAYHTTIKEWVTVMYSRAMKTENTVSHFFAFAHL